MQAFVRDCFNFMDKRSRVILRAEVQRIASRQSGWHILCGQGPQLARSSFEVLQLRSAVKQAAVEVTSCLKEPVTLQSFTMFGNTVEVSKTSLKNLKRITLKDLLMNEVATGGYLVLRTLEPAYKLVSITTAVEDQDGNAIFFHANNLTDDRSPKLDDILPVGTVFILKEPCNKLSDFGESILRCCSPSDIIILHKEHELFQLAEGIVWKNHIDPKFTIDPVWRHPEPKTAFEWNQRGNDFYNLKKFEYSARSYLISLRKIAELGDEGPMVKILQLNLSAVYLQLGFFEKALDFAEKVLMVDPGSRKALYRAGRACHQLRKYQDAKLHFEKCCGLYPDDEETKSQLQKSKDRCHEQETGEFDMYKMHLCKRLHFRQKLDCADYVGPIKVIEIEGKGRGVVATRDLEPGTLLVVSKAVSFEWPPENKIQHKVISNQRRIFENIQDVVAKLAHLIAKNPHTFGPIVYDLFDGIKHVKNISEELFCDPETKQELIVDVQRLNAICVNNCFCACSGIINPENIFASKISKKMDPLGEGGTGLYAVPSYFNHSCFPNAHFQIFNDVIFVRANTYIKAEGEVLLSYCGLDLLYPGRRFFCEKRGFQCCCTICKKDRKLPSSIHCKREKIMSKFIKISRKMKNDPASNNPSLAQRQIKNLKSEMDGTYSNCGPDAVKSGLFPMYIKLAHSCAWTSDTDGEIENLHNALAIFGFYPQILLSCLEKRESLIPPNALLNPYVFETIAKLIVIYHKTGQIDLKRKWLEIICALEKIYSGGDINVIKLNWDVLKEMI